MSVIIFDCLVLPEEATVVRDAFVGKLEQFQSGGVLHDFEVTVGEVAVDKQLVGQWEQEHPDEPLGDRTGYRYELAFVKDRGSLNQLAMALSEVLTPKTELPAEPAMREVDVDLQGIAAYPWTVHIRP